MWSGADALETGKVQNTDLADRMRRHMILFESDITVTKYCGSFTRWQIFYNENGYIPLPAQPTT